MDLRSSLSKPASLGPRVFVSYSFSNAEATAFRDFLQESGFAVDFIEATTLLGELSLSAALIERIRAADYVVPLVDHAAIGSQYVRLEIETALGAGVPVIPVLAPGSEPAGILADIPCLTRGTPAAVRDAILRRMSPLVFAPSAPMHLTPESLQVLMTTGAPPFVDADQLLMRNIRQVIAAIIATGHDGAIAQAVRMWRGLHDGLQELQDIALAYRNALEPLLKGWNEPAEGYRRSWDALTALLVGRHLNRLAWMFEPARNDSWGGLRDGMIRARQGSSSSKKRTNCGATLSGRSGVKRSRAISGRRTRLRLSETGYAAVRRSGTAPEKRFCFPTRKRSAFHFGCGRIPPTTWRIGI
jgi:hypothetical protein